MKVCSIALKGISMSVPWVEASRSPKVPGTNAHASSITPLVFLVLHVSWFTFGIVLFVIVWVAYLSIKGRSVTWLLNKIKSKARAGRVSARPFYYRRRAIRIESYDESNISLFRKVG